MARNAVKLAVYDAMMIIAKNHQTEMTMRPDTVLGEMVRFCCMNAPHANQNELNVLNTFVAVDARLDGCCCSCCRWDRVLWWWRWLDGGVGGIWSTDSPAGKLNTNRFTTYSFGLRKLLGSTACTGTRTDTHEFIRMQCIDPAVYMLQVVLISFCPTAKRSHSFWRLNFAARVIFSLLFDVVANICDETRNKTKTERGTRQRR